MSLLMKFGIAVTLCIGSIAEIETNSTTQSPDTKYKAGNVNGNAEIQGEGLSAADEMKPVLTRTFSGLAGVDDESFTIIKLKPIDSESGRRLESGISVDYTIAFETAEVGALETKIEAAMDAINSLEVDDLKSALKAAAQAAGVEFDVEKIEGFEVTAVKEIKDSVVTDLELYTALVGLTCGAKACTIEDLIGKCSNEEWTDNEDLCKQVESIIQQEKEEHEQNFESYVDDICSMTEVKADCDEFFDFNSKESGDESESDSSLTLAVMPVLSFVAVKCGI